MIDPKKKDNSGNKPEKGANEQQNFTKTAPPEPIQPPQPNQSDLHHFEYQGDISKGNP